MKEIDMSETSTRWTKVPVPQPQPPQPKAKPRPFVSWIDSYFILHVFDSAGNGLWIDFGSTPEATEYFWIVRGTHGKAADFDSLGVQWGRWRYEPAKMSFILSPGQLPRWMLDLFVLSGAKSRPAPGDGGQCRYVLRQSPNALADPISWERLSGDLGDQIQQLEQRHIDSARP
jgi:hypothetical protein